MGQIEGWKKYLSSRRPYNLKFIWLESSFKGLYDSSKWLAMAIWLASNNSAKSGQYLDEKSAASGIAVKFAECK